MILGFILGLTSGYAVITAQSFWPLMAGVFELVARSVCAFTLPIWFGYAGICVAGPIAWFSAAITLGVAYFVIIPKVKIPSSETLPVS